MRKAIDGRSTAHLCGDEEANIDIPETASKAIIKDGKSKIGMF